MYAQLLLIFLLGASLASFASLIGQRTCLNHSIVRPRSSCDQCHHPLDWIDLIPVISYFYLAGRSRCCRQPLSEHYLIMEVIGGLAGWWVTYLAWQNLSVASLFALLIFFGIALSVSDLQAFILPNPIMLAFFACSLAYVLVFIPHLFWWRLATLLTIFALLLTLTYLHPRGLGGGDLKLISILAFLLGFHSIFISLFIASALGLIAFALSLVTAKKVRYLPFGPFLFVGALTTLFVDYLFF